MSFVYTTKCSLITPIGINKVPHIAWNIGIKSPKLNIKLGMAYNESAMKMKLYKFEHLQKMYTKFYEMLHAVWCLQISYAIL